jgi:hypothetical protein
MPEQRPPTHLVVPGWFWQVIESAKPELRRLVEWLEAAKREQIVAFQRSYEAAAEAVCDYWNGPIVDGIGFSEDDTKDLCHWIVSQGSALWLQAISATDLTPFVRLYWAAEYKGAADWPKWNSLALSPVYHGFQAPGSVAYRVFEARFSEALDEYVNGESGA